MSKPPNTRFCVRTALALRPRGVLSLQNGLVENVLCEACGALPVGQWSFLSANEHF